MTSGIIVLMVVLAIFVLAGIGLVSIVKKPGEENKKRFKDTYFYFMALVALFVLYWGVADLLRVILDKWWTGGVASNTTRYISTYSQEQWLRGLSLRVSAILVSLPIWFFHWHKAVAKAKEEVDEAGLRAYSFIVVLVMGLSSIGMLIGALYLGVNALLGIALNTGEKHTLAMLLPYSLGALVLWWTHWKIWHEGRKKAIANEELKIENVQ